MEIVVKNYQILESAKVILDGIVLITGVNNSGKTSIQRALKSLILNQSNESNVRSGTSAFMIGIKDEKNEVIFRKSLKEGNLFRVNDVSYKKVGKDKLSKIYPKFDIKEIQVSNRNVLPNFIFFGELGFPFNMSDNEIYEIFYRYMGLGTVEEIAEDVRSEIKRLKAERVELEGAVSYIESNLKDIREKIVGYEPSIWYEDKRDRLNRAFTAYDQIVGFKESLDEVRSRIGLFEVRKKAFEVLDEIKFKNTDKQMEELTTLKDTRKELVDVMTKVKVSERQKSTLPEHDFKDLEVSVYQIDKLKPLKAVYGAVLGSIESKGGVFKNIKVKMKEAQKELDEVDACPLCGRKF